MSTNDAEPATPGIICPECNHANRASARFCSQCGTDLSQQTIIVAPVRRDLPATAVPASHAETAPMPPSPPPDVAATPAGPFAAASAGGSSKPWIAIVVAALVVIAAVAWWFVRANRPAEIGAGPKQLPDPAPAASATLVPPAAPAAPVVASAPASEPAAVSASLPASAPEAATAPATPPATPRVATTREPANAATPAPLDTDVQHTRAAQARAKAANAKAARDAKAKALQEQQAEQEAARKRADEARARAALAGVAKPAPPAPVATARTVQDICGGRNAISQAICESRECGKPEHSGEPRCLQIKAAEDRRSGSP